MCNGTGHLLYCQKCHQPVHKHTKCGRTDIDCTDHPLVFHRSGGKRAKVNGLRCMQTGSHLQVAIPDPDGWRWVCRLDHHYSPYYPTWNGPSSYTAMYQDW